GGLIVQVDVEELAGFPSLRDAVHEVESGHLLVRDFGIDADHLGMIERGNESQVVAGGGHVDVATGLVGLGFKGEAVLVSLSDVVLAEIVDGLAQTLDGFVGAAAGVGLDTFAATPEDEDFRAQLGSEVHGTQSLLQGVGAHLGIVGGKGAVAEDGMKKQVHGCHGDDDSALLAGFFELATIRSRSAGVASIGTRSLSCRLTPQAPISPRTDAISVGGMVRRTGSPKGSRPRLPKVHNPKENLCSGLGW